MQTATLPINVALRAGASGETLYHYAWQSTPNATYGRVFRTYDATEAVKEVTKSACAKLKSDHESNLRVYLIKYRKQTKYKHPVTQEATDFDYNYLDARASDRDSDAVYDASVTDSADAAKNKYIYGITGSTLAAAQENLNKALTAIAADIEKRAKKTDAKTWRVDEEHLRQSGSTDQVMVG